MKVPTFRKFGFKKSEMESMERKNLTISQLLGHELPLGIGAVIGLIIYAINFKTMNPTGVMEIVGQLFIFGSVGLIAVGIPMVAFHYINKWYYKYLEKHNPQYQQIQKFKAARVDFDHWKLRTDENFWKHLDGMSVEMELRKLYGKLGYTIHEAVKISNSRDDSIMVMENEEIYLRCLTQKVITLNDIKDFHFIFTKSYIPKGILFSLHGFPKELLEKRWENITFMNVRDVTTLSRNLTTQSEQNIPN